MVSAQASAEIPVGMAESGLQCRLGLREFLEHRQNGVDTGHLQGLDLSGLQLA